jgi:tocopherol O-methyltransferase
LTKAALENEASTPAASDDDGFIKLGDGQVKFLELDAEKMGDFFDDQQGSFDAVWISEALSHFPNKALFFKNVMKVLKPGGKLVLADWFKAENLDDTTFTNDIKPIEGKVPRKTLVTLSLISADGMLLPPLCTQQGYLDLARQAGLAMFADPKDISQQVRKTWYVRSLLYPRASVLCFYLLGILHGHSYKTRLFGHLHLPKVVTALPSYNLFAQ